MAEHLLETVEAVTVHQFPDVGPGPLVLHPGLDQIYGVHGRRAGGAGDRSQGEPIGRFQDLNGDASILGALRFRKENLSSALATNANSRASL